MNGKSRSDVSRALRKVAAFVDELSDDELEGFLRGTLHIELVQRRKDVADTTSAKESHELLAALLAATSRNGAFDLLRSKKRSRGELTQIARQLQVHVEKHDRIELIEEKIVESAVGARLRSDAIQGVSLKGSSSESASSETSDQESVSPSPPRATKDAPRGGRNGSSRRGLSQAQRDDLRKQLLRVSDQLYGATRDTDWWRRKIESDIPELADGVDAALAEFPEHDELRKSGRVLKSRLERAVLDAKDGTPIGLEPTHMLAAALGDFAAALTRVEIASATTDSRRSSP